MNALPSLQQPVWLNQRCLSLRGALTAASGKTTFHSRAPVRASKQ